MPEGSDIATVEDLADKTVAAQNGTTGKDLRRRRNRRRRAFGDYPNGPATIAALDNGQVEAAIIDEPVAQDAIDKGQTGFEIATDIPTGELYGLALSKEHARAASPR